MLNSPRGVVVCNVRPDLPDALGSHETAANEDATSKLPPEVEDIMRPHFCLTLAGEWRWGVKAGAAADKGAPAVRRGQSTRVNAGSVNEAAARGGVCCCTRLEEEQPLLVQKP